MNDQRDLTLLLKKSDDGDRDARERVLEMVYRELHRMAKKQAWNEGETIRPTVLVNEAYMKLFGSECPMENRGKLFAHAALAMRQVVLNHAEKARAKKRGGGAAKLTLEERDVPPEFGENYEDLYAALELLEEVHPRYAQILGLSYFAGFKREEIAALMGISETTVYQDLRLAKAWLQKKLKARKQGD